MTGASRERTDMAIETVPLSVDEAALRRFIEELWLPYSRTLESVVDRFALADGVDLVDEQLSFYRERLGTEGFSGWVAVDGYDGEGLAGTGGDLVGFVTTDVEPSPEPFDRPDRLVVCDLYVAEPYRGTGLADDLFDRAERRARERGCGECRLEVDEDNERAMAFYERRGFEVSRYEMVASVDGG